MQHPNFIESFKAIVSRPSDVVSFLGHYSETKFLGPAKSASFTSSSKESTLKVFNCFYLFIYGRIWKICHLSPWFRMNCSAAWHRTAVWISLLFGLLYVTWIAFETYRKLAVWWLVQFSFEDKLIQNHEQAQSSLSLQLSFVVLTFQMSSLICVAIIGLLKWGFWLRSCLHSGVNVLVFLGERHGAAVAISARFSVMASWFWMMKWGFFLMFVCLARGYLIIVFM